jgi:hypothetical protein
MLTVKMYRSNGTHTNAPWPDAPGQSEVRIVEAREVRVFTLTDELVELQVVTDADPRHSVFYFTPNNIPSDHVQAADFYRVGYVENAKGATTHVIKFD